MKNKLFLRLFFLGAIVSAIFVNAFSMQHKPAKIKRQVGFLDEIGLTDFEKKVPGYFLQDRLSRFLGAISADSDTFYELNSPFLPLNVKIELISFLLTKEPFFSLDTLLSKMVEATNLSTGAQHYRFKDPFQNPLQELYKYIQPSRGPKIILNRALVDSYKEELENFLARFLALKKQLEQESPEQRQRRLQSEKDRQKAQKQQIEKAGEQSEVQGKVEQQKAQDEEVQGSSDTESLESDSSKEKQSSDPESIASPAVSRSKSKRRRRSKQSARAANSDQSETVVASAAASSLEPAVFTLPEGMLQVPFYKSDALQEWNRLFMYLATLKPIDFRGFPLQENRFLQEQGYFENPETVKDNKAKQSRAALYQRLLRTKFTDDEIFLRLSFVHSIPDELTTLVLSMFYETLASDEAVKAKTITINIPIALRFGDKSYEAFNYTLIASCNKSNHYFIFHELLYQNQRYFQKLDIKLKSNYSEINPRFEFKIDKRNENYILKDRATEQEIFYRISQDVTKGTIAIEEN